MWWLLLLLLLLLVLVIIIVSTSQIRSRSLHQPLKKRAVNTGYRISAETSGGNFYLVAYGLSNDTVIGLNKAKNNVPPLIQSSGTMYFIFRPFSDNVNTELVLLNPAKFLAPLGGDASFTADDRLMIDPTSSTDAKTLMKTSSELGTMPIAPCYPSTCAPIPSGLVFGGSIGTATFAFQSRITGSTITATTITDGFNYLNVGRQICPPVPPTPQTVPTSVTGATGATGATGVTNDQINNYNFLLGKCAVFPVGQAGGCYHAVMSPTPTQFTVTVLQWTT